MTLGSGAADLGGRSCVALDLDGVVYRGAAAVPGAADAVGLLRLRGVRVVFTTNNSGSTRDQVAAKLTGLGIACAAEDVLTSGYLAARRVHDLLGDGGQVLRIGTAGLSAELVTARLHPTDDPQRAEAVLVGLDPTFSYAALASALTALRRGLPLVGCNRDADYPVSPTDVLPGCGPLLAAVETAAQRPADHVVGKPGADMLVLAAQTSGTTLDDWFVVGDSPAADLGMARAAGVPGVLVAHPEAAHADLAGVVRAWAA